MHTLHPNECRALAHTLPDTPETCIAIHALASGRCRAWTIHPVQPSRAFIVDPRVTPDDLLAFGDPQALLEILRELSDWKCVEVAPNIADEVADGLARDLGVRIDRSADLYFTLEAPAQEIPNRDVRLLTPRDAELYMRSAPFFGDTPEEARLNLLEGPVVAAIIDGRVVCAVEANARTTRYANFCVETLPEYRKLGLCTAASALAAQVVQSMGFIPLWSYDEHNLASRRVAEKVGFRPVSHCIYLMPQWDSRYNFPV